MNFQADKLVDIRLRHRNKMFLINEPRISDETQFPKPTKRKTNETPERRRTLRCVLFSVKTD